MAELAQEFNPWPKRLVRKGGQGHNVGQTFATIGWADLKMRLNHVLCAGPHGLHRLAYREWGDAANPRVLFCLHGLTRSGLDFEPVAEALADGWRVIAPDLPGRGDSDWLPIKQDYNPALYLADCITLIARLNVEKIHWLGTSLGGIVGMSLACLPHNPIVKLVLNDVGPFIPGESLRRIAGYIGANPRFTDLAQVAGLLKFAAASFGPLSDAQWLRMAELSTRPAEDGQGLRLHYDPGIAETFGAALDQDVSFWPVWDAITCPSLVIRGGLSDLLLADTALGMTRRGPKAQLWEIPETGHAPMLWQPDQIARLRDFLEA